MTYIKQNKDIEVLQLVVFLYLFGPWSAYRLWSPGKHGYGRLKIFNSTHINWQQVIALENVVEDEIWIRKY